MVATNHILARFAEPLVGERADVHYRQVREKPSMSFDHAGLMTYLELQLDRRSFSVRLNHGRLRQGDRTYDIPGVIVIPAELAEPLRWRSTSRSGHPQRATTMRNIRPAWCEAIWKSGAFTRTSGR